MKQIGLILIILMLLTGLALSAPMTAGYIQRAKTGTVLIDSAIYQNVTNIGIGSTSPTSKLAVDGTVYISNTGLLGGFVLCKEAAATGRIGHCTSLTAASGVCATCVVP